MCFVYIYYLIRYPNRDQTPAPPPPPVRNGRIVIVRPQRYQAKGMCVYYYLMRCAGRDDSPPLVRNLENVNQRPPTPRHMRQRQARMQSQQKPVVHQPGRTPDPQAMRSDVQLDADGRVDPEKHQVVIEVIV